MINQWGKKHFIALTQPFPSYQAKLFKPSTEKTNTPWSLAAPRIKAGKLAGLSTSLLSPESLLNGLNLCLPALFHLLIRPQETAWFPNGSMACSWPQNKGRGEQRSKVKAQKRYCQKKKGKQPLLTFGNGGPPA